MRLIVLNIRPEAEWSNHEQAEKISGYACWRAELVSVAIDWDDSWLGVKG